MSSRRQSTGEDYPEASHKHCLDSRGLLDQGRYDNAAYLAGYVAECILKTLIQVEQGHADAVKGHGHDLGGLDAEALRLAAVPGARTARYTQQGVICGIPYDVPPQGWKEVLRYYPEGQIPRDKARTWVEEAERMYIEIIGGLLKDGEI